MVSTNVCTNAHNANAISSNEPGKISVCGDGICMHQQILVGLPAGAFRGFGAGARLKEPFKRGFWVHVCSWGESRIVLFVPSAALDPG